MGMARGETGDRGAGDARGEPVAELAIFVSTAYADHADTLRSHLAAYTRDLAFETVVVVPPVVTQTPPPQTVNPTPTPVQVPAPVQIGVQSPS